MMQKLIFKFSIIYLLIVVSCGSNSVNKYESKESNAPSHEEFTNLLQQHVHGDRVDYAMLQKDSTALNKYLNTLSNTPPNDKWTVNEKLAYWINAYNGFTLKLIIDNYPVKSITDLHPTIHIPLLNTVWHKSFFKIGGEEMSLDHIEHKILRKKFNEPRIHFAINCASISCPPLRNEAYNSKEIDSQLNKQGVAFINDESKNLISPNKLELSKIFTWFKGDFTKESSLVQYIQQFTNVKIQDNADINYLDYDWDLNDLDK